MTPDSQTSSKNTPTFTNTQSIHVTQQSTLQQVTVPISHHSTNGYPYKEHQQELLAEYHEVLREVREKRLNKTIQESQAIKQHSHRNTKKHKNRSRSRSRSPSSRKHKKHHHKRSSSRKHSQSSRSRSRSTSPSSNRHKKKKYSHHHHKSSRTRDESTKTLPVYL